MQHLTKVILMGSVEHTYANILYIESGQYYNYISFDQTVISPLLHLFTVLSTEDEDCGITLR